MNFDDLLGRIDQEFTGQATLTSDELRELIALARRAPVVKPTTQLATAHLAHTIRDVLVRGDGTIEEYLEAGGLSGSWPKLEAAATVLAETIAVAILCDQVQTRKRGDLEYFTTLAEAFAYANKDHEVEKVSWSHVTGERVRMVRVLAHDHDGRPIIYWVYEPIVEAALKAIADKERGIE